LLADCRRDELRQALARARQNEFIARVIPIELETFRVRRDPDLPDAFGLTTNFAGGVSNSMASAPELKSDSKSSSSEAAISFLCRSVSA